MIGRYAVENKNMSGPTHFQKLPPKKHWKLYFETTNLITSLLNIPHLLIWLTILKKLSKNEHLSSFKGPKTVIQLLTEK